MYKYVVSIFIIYCRLSNLIQDLHIKRELTICDIKLTTGAVSDFNSQAFFAHGEHTIKKSLNFLS